MPGAAQEALPEWREVLTPGAIAFVNELADRFSGDRARLLARRASEEDEFDAGKLPDFPAETRELRAADWRIGDVPDDLLDRRVEITGPPERKMVINALNSGANVFMADFEDSLSPTWANLVDGQANLMRAVRRELTHTTPEGKAYRLHDRTAVLVVRPRGWHLPEKHWLCAGEPIAGAFMDFGLYLHHNAVELLRRGTGPYFYLPKLENRFEARLWAGVIAHAERTLGLARGTVKVTVLIETITAAFEIDEILYELRENIVGLNCGRWDYIFSFIKKLGHRPEFVLPDRGSVTMTSHFLRSYSQLVIQRCHRRGAFAMGGMAAQIPIKSDPDANARALSRVRADKEREAGDGHDGTWVAHPGLVPVAREVFDRLMPGPNNLGRMREDVQVSAADLLRVPEGRVTRAGLRNNIDVGLRYLAAWLGGNGCVPIHHLMEDAATAEISRAQLWQWARHATPLEDGTAVTLDLVRQEAQSVLAEIRRETGEEAFGQGHFARAATHLDRLTAGREFEAFLTLHAYEDLD
ncbi:MAG TPA: malate synthase A [Steroidobacteraceae bacterium]|jgi:malate synthase|nr:malate synthase A [Steroidobacteraceae bacterium]